uniref:Peptidase S1 domain-containing protein n=1 Tax=Stomoxys calcitrans TaxID=35570 RepID=A0A1I8NYN1_STOCA
MKIFFCILFVTLISSLPINQTCAGKSLQDVSYVVSIHFQKFDNQYDHQCLGAIIQEQIILTAAHCFYSCQNPKKFRLIINKNKKMNSSYYQEVATIVLHENFYPLQGNDIALVKLAVPMVLDGKFLKKLNYNHSESIEENVQGYAIGRNRSNVLKPNGSSNKSLEAMDNVYFKLIPLRIIDYNRCRQRKFVHLTRNELCTLAYETSGPCDGDSGGPLVNEYLNVQWGLLSYSRSMCKPHRIYVFTRLQPFVEWINKTMGEMLT